MHVFLKKLSLQSMFFFRTRLVHLVMMASIVALFTMCAKVVAPSGGPSDALPPVLLEVEPTDALIGFNGDRIELTFDEFFTIKNPSRSIYINPLTDDEIKYKIKGKKLVLFIPEVLPQQGTYSLVLHEAVADFHEGNILKEMSIVFTTGASFDSLSVSGKVVDAETGNPIEGAVVYLFPENADSLLLKKQYAFISRTDARGTFTISLLPQGTYKLYALFDKDFDHVYGRFEEKAAFYSQTIVVQSDKVNDSTIVNEIKIQQPLAIFQEQDTVLKILKTTRVRKGFQQISFNMPVHFAQIEMLDSAAADSMFFYMNSAMDTAYVWFIGQKEDVTRVCVKNGETTLDTLTLSLKPIGREVNAYETYQKPVLKITRLVNSSYLQQMDTLRLFSSNPIRSIQKDSILLLSEGDTIPFDLVKMDDNPREMKIVFDRIAGKDYKLLLDQGAIEDCFLLKSDSTLFTFTTITEQYFGRVKINIADSIEGCHGIDFINGQQQKIHSFHFDGPQKEYVFLSILPGDYIVRLYLDENCNKKWDTGSLQLNRQPEKTFKISSRLIVKSDWDNEVIWSME